MSKPKIIFELPLGGYFSIPPLILDSLVGKSLRLCTVNQLWGRTDSRAVHAYRKPVSMLHKWSGFPPMT